MRRSWISIVAFAAVFVLAVGLAIRPSGVRLADGTYLRLLAATVGPNHVFTSGERFERQPFVLLPLWLRDRLGWRGYAATVSVADPASMMLWFTSYSPETRSLKPRTFTRIELVAGNGDILSVAGQAPVLLAHGETGLVLFPGVTNFPAGSRLRFRYGPAPGAVTEVNPPRRLN